MKIITFEAYHTNDMPLFMMNIEVSKQLQEDFERYMIQFLARHQRFTFEDFGNFAVTLLNYNVNNHIIDLKLKKQYAYFLTSLYNKGIGNRITEEDLQEIAHVIATDHRVDFNIINELYG